MEMNKSIQETWHNIRHILQNYILNTSIPLIFRDLLDNPDAFENSSFVEFAQNPPKPKEDQSDESSDSSVPTQDGKKKYHYYYTNTWEMVLKEGLTEVFMERLLGTQEDMFTYRLNACRYSQVFDDIFGTHTRVNNLHTITIEFFAMLKDYLLRNLEGYLPPHTVITSTGQLLTACRLAYRARRFYYEEMTEELHALYVPFDKLTYSFGLIQLMDEIADNPDHQNCRHFLVTAEYIHTLFIYVYMVEFIKHNPLTRQQTKEDMTEAKEQAQKFNLFTYLSKLNYKYAYFEYLRRFPPKKNKDKK